ncbi:hypothetical protein P9302_12570 [Brevibacillus agri]|uniref:hypothetical protein n=1 Tax=Brevibacillus agri TaxID=51101 RepID=UPI002E21FA1D|nr:hypothetical protein [Brevibacillus agri]
MIYEVTTGNSRINFGATGVDAILQNVAFILSTTLFSCPLDRAFAWDPDIDSPIQMQSARNIARITAAIQKYEPRATVVSIEIRGDPQNGSLQPVVGVSIDDEV